MDRQRLSFDQVHGFLDEVFGGDIHAKRVLSLSQAALGVIASGSLAINLIGQGLAIARGLSTKHATKQVDRLLSNPGLDMARLRALWVGHIVGDVGSIKVAMDWTDFDADKHATLMLSVITNQGRATPLYWFTVSKAELKNRRNHFEYQALVGLAEALPAQTRVCIVADRGFGDHKLYRLLSEELKFDYVIRFRGNITVTATTGETRTAAGWVGAEGRARVLREASVTAEHYRLGAVICVKDKGMKQAWCLATNRTDLAPRDLIALYGSRWGIECAFRDTKDLRFGMGLDSIHVASPQRRDCLWLLNPIAVVLLTVLGAAGEAIGLDRMLRTNTAKHRMHSLFRQGCMLHELIPNMPEARLLPLIEKFSQMIANIPFLAAIIAPRK